MGAVAGKSWTAAMELRMKTKGLRMKRTGVAGTALVRTRNARANASGFRATLRGPRGLRVRTRAPHMPRKGCSPAVEPELRTRMRERCWSAVRKKRKERGPMGRWLTERRRMTRGRWMRGSWMRERRTSPMERWMSAMEQRLTGGIGRPGFPAVHGPNERRPLGWNDG